MWTWTLKAGSQITTRCSSTVFGLSSFWRILTSSKSLSSLRLPQHPDPGALISYLITAAPQCPFPDEYIGATLSSVPFDAIYVQFCSYPLHFTPSLPSSSDNVALLR